MGIKRIRTSEASRKYGRGFHVNNELAKQAVDEVYDQDEKARELAARERIEIVSGELYGNDIKLENVREWLRT